MRQVASAARPLLGLVVTAVSQFSLDASPGGSRLPNASKHWYPQEGGAEVNRSQSSQTKHPTDPSTLKGPAIAEVPKDLLAGCRLARCRSPNLPAGRYSWPG